MFLILFLKGFLIGIAFIIPGLSGGTLAIYLGIYQPMLHAIGHFFQAWKKHFFFLLPIGLGIVLAIVVFARLIGWLLNVNSFATLLFFIGLLLGGLKKLSASIQVKTQSKVAYGLAFFAFVLVIGLFLSEQFASVEGVVTAIPISGSSIFLLLVLGAVAATTMIVPGVSGSALLMVLGYYTAIVTNVIGNVFDFSQMGYHAFVIGFFAIGGVLGIFFASRFLDKIINRYPSESMTVIFGFLLSSAIVLFLQIHHPDSAPLYDMQEPIYLNYWNFLITEWPSVIAGILMFITGFYTSRKMVLLEHK